MKVDNIKEIVKYLKSVNYRDLFGAVCVFEYADFLHDLEELDNSDIEYLEDMYDYFLDNDYFSGLFNVYEIQEAYEEAKENGRW